MKISTVNYRKNTGWSTKEFPDYDSENTLILIFGAPEYADYPEPFDFLAKRFPKSKIVGCSTAGEIFLNEIFDNTLSVAILKFEHTDIKVTTESVNENQSSISLGEKLGVSLFDPNLKNVLILSDGLTVNGTELIEGLNKVLPDNVSISGGLAGDNDKFEKTWVLHKNRPEVGYVTAIGFYGDRMKFSYGSKGGWDMFGLERKITKSKDNVLYEIDGEPALKLYKEYLGDRAKGLPSTALLFPLSIRETPESEKRLVRTILAVDEKENSMTFAGDIPHGWCAQFMKANFDRLIDGAAHAGQNATSMVSHQGDTFCIAISCVGRRLVLGEQTEEEVEATLSMLPDNTKLIGFYSYGEISPHGHDRCNLHNQTMTLTLFSEK